MARSTPPAIDAITAFVPAAIVSSPAFVRLEQVDASTERDADLPAHALGRYAEEVPLG
ncbi:MAG: hypothetical protein JO325_01770, partial [Solirubrobacterales bacterium]|nr:hypothetical protein [Solirubrobacterales bacterium]